jgi:ribonuclease HI
MTEWLSGWKSRGWRSASGEEVKNQALWIRLENEASKRTVQWQWVRGHNDHPENERCDALLNEAMDEYKNKTLLPPEKTESSSDLGVFEI